MRCRATGKFKHGTITDALDALRSMCRQPVRRILPLRMDVYACRCGYWHLGSSYPWMNRKRRKQVCQ